MKNLLFYSIILLFCCLKSNGQAINNNGLSKSNKFVISTDKTRMFYKGLLNPLTISTCGSDKINVTVEGAGANIRKVGSGQYEVICTKIGTAIVTVKDGKQIQKLEIPVKRVPDPIAIVGGSAGGIMPVAKFIQQSGVYAELKDFLFEGVKFKVLSYIVIAMGKGFEEPDFAEVYGSAFYGGAAALIRKCQPGTTVTIGEIKVSEPGGGTRKIDQTITFILQ